jgi:hypothetical protein
MRRSHVARTDRAGAELWSSLLESARSETSPSTSAGPNSYRELYVRASIRLIVIAALMPILLLGAARPVHALAGGLMQGSGTISPGLTAVPAPQVFSFSGSSTLGGFSGSGTDLAGSIFEGVGTILVRCPLFTRSGVWSRVGWTVHVVLTNGGGGEFAFIPDQVGAPPEAGGSTVVSSYSFRGFGLCT